jgi:hypothetical protein
MSAAELQAAGEVVRQAIARKIAENPRMPSAWIASSVYSQFMSGSESECSRWAAAEYLLQMVREFRGGATADVDELDAPAEAMRAHAAALAAFRDERGAA